MKLQRHRLSVHRMEDHADDNYVNASMAERIALAWQLTRELCALSPRHDAEQRLQRHIVRITRSEG